MCPCGRPPAFRAPARRRPLLVIVGPTHSGKSELARWLLRTRIGSVLVWTDFLEVTVEENAALELSDFDEGRHAGVLLDGVADAGLLARHREALQGRAKEGTGGKSSTMMYAYPFTLCKRAVVATMDLAAANLDYFQEHHWLRQASNVLVLRLSGPAWQPQ